MAGPVQDIDENDIIVTYESPYAAGFPRCGCRCGGGRADGPGANPGTLMKLNQRNGFDCPGCAWPETRVHRKHAEFCENGAKAVAEEATTRTVARGFFAANPILELLGKSDYWLGQQGKADPPDVQARCRPTTCVER